MSSNSGSQKFKRRAPGSKPKHGNLITPGTPVLHVCDHIVLSCNCGSYDRVSTMSDRFSARPGLHAGINVTHTR